MENQNIFSGKTVEEAVENGLRELNLNKEDAEIEVIDEGKKKLFGSIPAQVKVTPKQKLSDGERAVVFLEGLFDKLGQEVTVALTSEEEHISIELHTDTAKGIIGRRGEMIDAVQVLAGAVANTGRKDYKRVVVDCGNYREEREETLKHVAEKMAAKALRLGRKMKLEPMNPYERRIIHAALADNSEVITKSEGKEPNRVVVIIPKNPRPYNKDSRDKGNRNGGKGGKNDRKAKSYPKRELPSEDTPQSSGTSLGRSGGSSYKKGGFSGFFGTYLGNSRDAASDTENTPETTETEE